MRGKLELVRLLGGMELGILKPGAFCCFAGLKEGGTWFGL